MKTTRIFIWLLAMLVLSQTVKAGLDITLNWKIQQWQFVVIVQAGEQRTNNDGVYVEKNVVKILRGNEADLPKFEWWQDNDIKKGHYYLLTFYNSNLPPYQSASWGENRFDVEATNRTFVIKAIQDNQTGGFWTHGLGVVYRDLSVDDLQKLLADIPYESNPTNTFFYKDTHKEKTP